MSSKKKPVVQNKEHPEIPDVEGDGGPSSLDGITGGTSYSAGMPLISMPDRSSGVHATGTNLQAGYGDADVAALQRYLIEELGPDEENPTEFGNSSILPRFGVDGVWGCETQGAFNDLLKEKGIDKCNESESSPCGEGIPSCALDEETLQALKDADKKKEIEEEEEELETTPPTRSTMDDQCFLVSNIEKIVSDSKPQQASYHELVGESRKEIKYKNIHKLSTKDPATIMNRLRMTRGALEFLNIRHWQLSQLTPTIRIYKQYYEGANKPPREVEMKFRNYVDPVDDLQAMLDSQLQRGVGVGIEYFKYDLVGVQPATAKKDIRARLSIYAQNFNELFKTRTAVDQVGKQLEGGYRMIDLVLLEPKYRFIQEEGQNQKMRAFNPNFYEIKVVVGWAATGGGGLLSSDLTNAIRENQLTMFLTVTNHTFDFKEDGSVRLNLDFRARVESMMLDVRSDVLSDAKTRQRRKERKDKVREIELAQAELKKQKKEACSDDKIKELQEAYTAGVEKERENSYQSLLRGLMQNNAIYTAIITEETVKEAPDAAETGKPMLFSILHPKCSELSDEGVTEGIDLSKYSEVLKPGVRAINYFFLGDLIALATNNVLDRPELQDINYGNIKFVLGPAVFDNPDPASNGSIGMNIADIPISVELFNAFMKKYVVDSRRNTYPLLLFVRDVMKQLVFEALGPECFGGERRLSLLLDTSQISADSGAGNEDPMAVRMGENYSLDLDQFTVNLGDPSKSTFVFDSFNRKSMAESYNYFVIYAFNKEPRGLAFPDQSGHKTRHDRDFIKGIYHLTTGLDRGLVKDMQFTATTHTYLREARFTESDFNPELQLSNVYNVDVNLFGNNLFFPGQHIYINPRGLGSDELGDPGTPNTNANIMGLGGYHVVKSANNTIDRNGFSTKVDCLFSTSGDGTGTTITRKAQVGEQASLDCAIIDKEIKYLTESFNVDNIDISGGGT